MGLFSCFLKQPNSTVIGNLLSAITTLPVGIFMSYFHRRDLKTYPGTYCGHS